MDGFFWLVVANIYALIAVALFAIIAKANSPILLSHVIVPIFWPIWLILYIVYYLLTKVKAGRVA